MRCLALNLATESMVIHRMSTIDLFFFFFFLFCSNLCSSRIMNSSSEQRGIFSCSDRSFRAWGVEQLEENDECVK